MSAPRSAGSCTPRPSRARCACRWSPIPRRRRGSSATSSPTRRTGDPDNTVMLGAHLDSVPAGPGINDNASGSSALLEIAEGMAQLAKNKNKGSVTNRVAFAFWGAEESGLVGSTYFVENLSDAEKADIMANLNFDMLASPNFARLVYDGDGSSFGTRGPRGLGHHRARLQPVLRVAGARVRGDGVHRPLGLRAVHRRGHPCRRPVHGGRGAQDGGPGRPLRRRPGSLAGSVLPPGVRHAEHPARFAAGHRERVHPAARRPARSCRCRLGGQRDGRLRPDGRRRGARHLVHDDGG